MEQIEILIITYFIYIWYYIINLNYNLYDEPWALEESTNTYNASTIDLK